MKAIEINGKWYIEEYTKEFGNILILDKTKELESLEFNSEREALDCIVIRNNTVISLEESLEDIIPIPWSKEVLEGKIKVIISGAKKD